jgi:hypothetical protein
VRFPPYGRNGGNGWYVRIIQTPRSPRWVVCPDYSDAPVPPVAGMCGSPRMGVMAGMGGMPGSRDAPVPPAAGMCGSPRMGVLAGWVVCPDYSDTPVPPVAGMCGSPRMGMMAGLGGMSGLFRRPGPPSEVMGGSKNTRDSHSETTRLIDHLQSRVCRTPRSPQMPPLHECPVAPSTDWLQRHDAPDDRTPACRY